VRLNFARRLTISNIICISLLATASAQQQVSYNTVTAGKVIEGFKATALYLNDTDQPMGARLIHQKTGFTLDLLQIQSVPQASIWVHSFPTSDMGEPHTQEHLLLGHGNKGRTVASLEAMSLADSTAFTQPWRTVYQFNTSAGPEVFYTLLDRKLDALLHPDYTDEEIRREVRNFGVTENSGDHSLRVEEKGTVYNEMTSSSNQPMRRIFLTLSSAIYGKNHPLAYNSGGDPAALRKLQPADIRRFHADTYKLGNMGMVAAFPKAMELGGVLHHLDVMFNRLEPQPSGRKFKSETDLPPPAPAPAGSILFADYPHKNDQQPGVLMFAWPANLHLNPKEEMLTTLFIQNIAGDATTNLYKLFVDSKTRKMDLGAKSVYSYLNDDLGHPTFIGLTDVAVANMNEATISAARKAVMDEIARIAALPAGSPELADFNTRIKSRLLQARRDAGKLIDTPPQFGFRSTGPAWIHHLRDLDHEEGFRKSLTMKPDISFVEDLLARKENIWTAYIAKWKFASVTPFAAVARPVPALIKQDETERQARADAEVQRLKKLYGVSDDQETMRRYKAEYDANTATIEAKKEASSAQRFLDNPPLTADDGLDYKVARLTGDVPIVVSTFDSMLSSTANLCLRLDGLASGDLVYVSILPQLLTRVGVIQDGKPVSFERMTEMLRNQVLSLNANFSTNMRTDRVELQLRGAGNDDTESQHSIDWMKLVLLHPNWTPENLPRIRDAVDQAFSTLRNTMQGSEESWVNGPANAWLKQDKPLFLATSSFLTQLHNTQRLRWMLKDAGSPENRAAMSAFLAKLAAGGKGKDRAALKLLLAPIQAGKSEDVPPNIRALAADAARDLDQNLADIPDSTLSSDWAYVCNEISRDLMVTPEKALANLENVRKKILKTGGARMFLVGSRATQGKLQPAINSLVAGLEPGRVAPVAYADTKLIAARLRARDPKAADALFVGLLNPNSQGGVIINSASGPQTTDTSRDALLDFLASKMYAGGGAHSIFMKTWGAGLAYSNGLNSNYSTGRLRYYAERTPEMPQTLRFVVDEIRNAPHISLSEYSLAQAFNDPRSASNYEIRAEAMANNLADGETPDVVQRFRKGILALRKLPNLDEELQSRMPKVYSKVLPGLGGKSKDVSGGSYFVIGPEKQFALYEGYLKTVEGPDTHLFRLYPRDFWMLDAAN
jgi:Zn-dependent M16 (insulinase) family peptidase